MLINSTNFVNFFLENFARIFNRIRQGSIITIKAKKEKKKNLRLFILNWEAKNQKKKEKPKWETLMLQNNLQSTTFSNQNFLF
jgi:hypothetical protein